MSATGRDWKKDLAKAAFVAMPMLAPLVAGAKIDYEGVGYLGGSDKIDVNNANVRVYSRFPGMYPTVAGKIVSHGPYKSISDLYSISGTSRFSFLLVSFFPSTCLSCRDACLACRAALSPSVPPTPSPSTPQSPATHPPTPTHHPKPQA